MGEGFHEGDPLSDRERLQAAIQQAAAAQESVLHQAGVLSSDEYAIRTRALIVQRAAADLECKEYKLAGVSPGMMVFSKKRGSGENTYFDEHVIQADLVMSIVRRSVTRRPDEGLFVIIENVTPSIITEADLPDVIRKADEFADRCKTMASLSRDELRHVLGLGV